MKSTLLLSVFCATFFTFSIRSASSWTPLEKANRTNVKTYEKHCLGTIYNIGPMDKGEVRRIPGGCAQATCLEDRNIRFSGCPLVALSDRVKCRVYPGDLSKEYPDCCFEVRCNENNSTSRIYDGYVNVTAVDTKRKKKQERANKTKEEEKEKKVEQKE